MKRFAKYIRYRRKVIWAFLLFALIQAGLFGLYRLPIEAVAYPGILCLLLGGIFLAADFLSVKRTHERLSRMLRLTAEQMDDFPNAGSVTDEDYQALIRKLCQEQRTFSREAHEKYEDMVDYYTLWAHQIKTPIASMRLTLQNEDSPVSRKLRNDLGRVERYVEMVLTFLRLDFDSTDYVIRAYDLDEIVKGAVKKFSGEFIGKKLTLHYEPLNQKVLTDEKWLSFVVEQILSNALKYTLSGGIAIRMENPDTLCIADTGIGIAPSDLPRIFENGFTGCNGRIGKGASGIGLYLVGRVCKNLGHTISARSEVGKGTEIRIGFGKRRIEIE